MKLNSLVVLGICASLRASAFSADIPQFARTFPVGKSDLSSTGKSAFFILEPGFVSIFEGQEDGKKTVLTITVTGQTKTVDGVETRVVEEKETADGEVAEISLNYFAISKSTHDVYYFGEESHTYRHGKLANRSGSWLAGVAGAKFGLALPGKPKVGNAYYQEFAPKVAMDRAEIVSVTEMADTPAGHFKNCVKTRETTPLEKHTEYKLYAPGVGLIQDGDLHLVSYRAGAR